MALKRIIYSTQKIQFAASVAGTVTALGANVIIPVKSVSLSREIPMEPILALGMLKGYDQIQKGWQTFKMDLKCFLPKAVGSTAAIPPAFFNQLCKAAQKGDYVKFRLHPINVDDVFLKGILSNISLDNTAGDFIELGLSFQGLGDPSLSTGITNSVVAISTAPTDIITTAGYSAVEVYDSSSISIPAVYGETIKSAKFSFEMPNETIAHLGGLLNTTNALLTVGTELDKCRIIAKAPYKASLSFDGTHVLQNATARGRDLEGAATPAITFGNIPITIKNGALKSFNVSQTPGEIGAAFSASYEGTSVLQFFS